MKKRATKRLRVMNLQLRRDFKKFESELCASDFEKLTAWREGDEKPTFVFENQRRPSLASLLDENTDLEHYNDGVLDIVSDD